MDAADLPNTQTYLSGIVYDIDENPHEGTCWIYNSKGILLTKIATSSDGSFEVYLVTDQLFPDQKYSPQTEMKDKLTFRIQKDWESKVEEVSQRIVLAAHASIIKPCEIRMTHETQKESPPLSYMIRIAKAVVKASFISTLEKIKHFLFSTPFEQIRDEFNIQSHKVTEENFINFILNGIPTLDFKQEEDYLTAEINWDSVEFDQTNNLANVKIFLEKDSAGKLKLAKFTLQYRTTLNSSDDPQDKGPVTTYYPESNHFVEGAKNALASLHLYGQTNKHLADHKYGVFVSQAALDTLPGTTIGKLVLPFCSLIRTITDQLGVSAISGNTGILNLSALSVGGINTILTEAQMLVDPFLERPKDEINSDHTYAIGYNIFYKAMKQMVTQYLEDNWNTIQSEAEWKALHRFFARLHQSSPDYLPRGFENKESDESSDLPKRTKYREDDEVVRSIRPVAVNPEGPEEQDFEMISRFLAHLLTILMFDHSWEHYSQFITTINAPSSDDPDFAPIAPRTGVDGPCAGMSEGDIFTQMRIAKTFKEFSEEREYLLLEWPWVLPIVKKAVEGIEEELKEKCNFDVREKLLFTICI